MDYSLFPEKRALHSTANILNGPLNTVFEQQIQPLRNLAVLQLESASIPHSWYNISENLGNNVITITGTPATFSDANLTGDIDPSTGNPQIEDYLVTELTSLFVGGTWTVSLNMDATLTIDETTGTITDTFTVNSGVGYTLGLDPSVTYDPTTDFPLTTGVIDLQPVKELYIVISNTTEGIYTDGRAQSATFSMPVNGNFGDIERYNSKNGLMNAIPFIDKSSKCYMDNIGILIVNKHGKPIDLNNVPWHIILLARQYEQERPMPPRIGQYFV